MKESLKKCARSLSTSHKNTVSSFGLLPRHTPLSIQPELVPDPGILGGTLVAGEQIPVLLQHAAVEFARPRQIARHLVRIELLGCALPRLKVAQLVERGGLADPLHCLVVGDKVHVRVLLHVVQEALRGEHRFEISIKNETVEVQILAFLNLMNYF